MKRCWVSVFVCLWLVSGSILFSGCAVVSGSVSCLGLLTGVGELVQDAGTRDSMATQPVPDIGQKDPNSKAKKG